MSYARLSGLVTAGALSQHPGGLQSCVWAPPCCSFGLLALGSFVVGMTRLSWQVLDRCREGLAYSAERLDGPGSIVGPGGAICWICGVEVDRDSRSPCVLVWFPLEWEVTCSFDR